MQLRRFLIASAALTLAACGDAVRDLSAPTFTPGPPATLTASQAQIVMSGLDNPRGLAFGEDSTLYVAEAGRGGPGPCYLILGSTVCYGPTGAVSRLRPGESQERVITGLPSVAVAKSGRAEGPNGIALVGHGHMYVAIGLEADPAERNKGDSLQHMGRLVQIAPSALAPGHGNPHRAPWEFVGDIAGFEAANNTDCGEVDSNPFALLGEPGGLLISDAGANTVLYRGPTGELSVFASFSSSHSTALHEGCPLPAGYPAVQPEDMVPTSIVRGPDGAYYVSQLQGFPIIVGAAKVWRVVPGSAPEVYLTGFTFVVSIAFDDAGVLYVLQNQDGPGGNVPGSLIRVGLDGTRTKVLTGLTSPASVAVGPDGGIYVSNNSSKIGIGTVLRIAP